MDGDKNNIRAFLTSAPGILTGIAAVITAIVGLLAITGVFGGGGDDGASAANTPAAERPTESPADSEGGGIADACPDEDETINGVQDQDGCSDMRPFGPSLSLGKLRLAAGEVGSLTLEANGMLEPGLGAWTVDLHYSPSSVSVQGCVPNGLGACNPAFTENSIRIAGVNANGLVGDVALGSIEFQCVAAGPSTVSWSVSIIAYATAQEFTVVGEFGTITCVE